MIVVVTGGFSVAAATATRGIADNNSFQVSDDLTLVRGNHQIALGGTLAHFRVSFRTWARGGGQWNFTGQLSGLGLADMMLGRVATVDQSGLSGVDYYQWYQGVYAQDTWRASSRVTINAGLRWEPFFSQNLTRGANTIFDRDLFRQNVTSGEFFNAPAGLIYPGDPGFPRRHVGLEQEVDELLPARGRGLGRARRRPYSRSDRRTRSCTTIRVASTSTTSQRRRRTATARWSAILAGLFDDPYRDVGGNPHPIETWPQYHIPGGRDVLLDGSRHQCAARAVVECQR